MDVNFVALALDQVDTLVEYGVGVLCEEGRGCGWEGESVSFVDYLGEQTYAKGEDVALCDDDAFPIALGSFPHSIVVSDHMSGLEHARRTSLTMIPAI